MKVDNDDTVLQSLKRFEEILSSDYSDDNDLFYTKKILAQAIVDHNVMVQENKDLKQKLVRAHQTIDDYSRRIYAQE